MQYETCNRKSKPWKPFGIEINVVKSSREGFMLREGVVEAPRGAPTGSRRQGSDPLGHPCGGPARPSSFFHGSGGDGAWYA